MIAYCPSCYRPSRIPTVDSGQLQCPHCAEAFELHRAAHAEIGSFYHPTATESQTGNERFDFEVSSEESENDFQALLEPDDDREFELQPAGRTPGAMAVSGVDELQIHSPSSMRRRKQKSPIGSFIGVMFGGVAALPIATAIMWYGLGRDPFEIAPKVAEYVPWIVPDQLSGGSLARRSTQSPLQTKSTPPSNQNSHFTDDQLPPSSDLSASSDSEPEITPPLKDNDPQSSDASALPFAADTASEINGEVLIAYENLEQAFDEMLASKDELSISSFLDTWQRYVDATNSFDDVAKNTQLSKLESRLADLSDRALLTKIVGKSRAKFSQLQPNQELGYVDVFELEKVESEPLSDSVRLVPTSRNAETMKNMIVLASAQQFSSESSNAANQRFLLFGLAKKRPQDGKNAFYVLMFRAL